MMISNIRCIMATTQITRIRNADSSETLKKHIDGTTLLYSIPNLTTMLIGKVPLEKTRAQPLILTTELLDSSGLVKQNSRKMGKKYF